MKSTSRLLCCGTYHVMNEPGLLRKFRTASDERAQGLARVRVRPYNTLSRADCSARQSDYRVQLYVTLIAIRDQIYAQLVLRRLKKL